jgi:hypothetical protein
MAAGYQMRQWQAQEAVGDAPCPEGCGHRVRDHFNLQPVGLDLETGDTIHHPDYDPNEFHCRAEGCSCVCRPRVAA